MINQVNPIMSDAEVASFFRVSLCTLQRRMRDGFPSWELDISKATHYNLGNRRWWLRKSVEELARGAAA